MKLTIIDKDLCLIDLETKKMIKRYKPFSKIDEFKIVDNKLIIIRESTNNYENEKSNIYCLDNNFNIVWFSDVPIDKDFFPNAISWDKEINDNGTSWADYLIDNSNTLTCASQKGITVSIEYKTGKIIKSVFTK